MQQRFKMRKEQYELKAQRLAAGLCSACGERPRTHNMDRSLSIHCSECRHAKYADRIARRSAQPERPRPQSNDEWGIDEDFGYLGTERFRQYAAQLKRLIETTGHPTSIADHRRGLGGDFIDRMHCDALEYLEADGQIRQVPAGALTKYVAGESFSAAKLARSSAITVSNNDRSFNKGLEVSND